MQWQKIWRWLTHKLGGSAIAGSSFESLKNVSKTSRFEQWANEWEKADFSWAGLQSKGRWGQSQNLGLQDYIREIEGFHSDETLISSGRLVVVESALYHVAFISPQWARLKGIEVSVEDLKSRADAFWALVFKRNLAADLGDTLTGVHLYPETLSVIMGECQCNLKWCSLPKVSVNFRRNRRSLESCFVSDSLFIQGDYSTETVEKTLSVKKVHADHSIELSNVSGPVVVYLEACGSPTISLIHCELKELYIHGCEVNDLVLDKVTVEDNCEVFDVTAKDSSIYGSTFEGEVEIRECQYQSSFDCLRSDFKNRVTFIDTRWPYSRGASVCASGSRFDALVTISGKDPPSVRLFEDAEFHGGLALGDYLAETWQQILNSELGRSSMRLRRPDDHFAAKSIEAGCRNLRKIAEKAGDINSEHFWHRAELLARRRRTDSRTLERIFSDMYGLTADYGLSIGRPFVTLLFVIIIFGLIYAILGSDSPFAGRPSPSLMREGIGYSLNRSFPLGVFGTDSNEWRAHLIGDTGTWRSIAVRTVATMQSLMSAVLLYLGVMAVRRKFKIG